MTWLRYSDDHRRDPVWDGMAYDTRWLYDCLVECCAKRHDGRIPMKTALRCSDVDEPDRSLKELVEAGLVDLGENVVLVVRAYDHVPPPGVLQNAEKSKVRMRRMRAHRNGDHSLCLPEHCPDACYA